MKHAFNLPRLGIEPGTRGWKLSTLHLDLAASFSRERNRAFNICPRVRTYDRRLAVEMLPPQLIQLYRQNIELEFMIAAKNSWVEFAIYTAHVYLYRLLVSLYIFQCQILYKSHVLCRLHTHLFSGCISKWFKWIFVSVVLECEVVELRYGFKYLQHTFTACLWDSVIEHSLDACFVDFW